MCLYYHAIIVQKLMLKKKLCDDSTLKISLDLICIIDVHAYAHGL